MKNNTLTKINYFFWNNINYYFYCFKKRKVDEQNDADDDNDNDDLLGVQTIIIYNE
jgi:hypothetical protein